jgi:hypothetical protein
MNAGQPKGFRAKKKPHWEKPPFIYAKCPDRYKPILKYVILAFGMLGFLVLFFGGVLIVIIGPVWMMVNEPYVPISKALIWCSQLFGVRLFWWIYLFVSLLVFSMLLYCSIGIDYFTYSQWVEDPKSEHTEELEQKDEQKH